MISHPVPATTNVLGVKGCGAGCAGSLTSVMNAITDALSEYGIRHMDIPATPYRVWRAIQDARARPPERASGSHDDAGHRALASTRPGGARLIAGVCAAHLVSHYYMVLLAALFVFIKADYGVSYTEPAWR